MKNFLLFLESSADDTILALLKCSKDESKILQFLLKEYFKESSDARVIEVLRQLGATDAEKILEMLPMVSNLMRLGLIALSSTDKRETSALELLHAHIALSSYFFRLLDSGEDRAKIKLEPYADQNDYLRDEFLKVALLQEISIDPESKKAGVLLGKLQDLQTDISKRLAMTKKHLGAPEILKSLGLSDDERTIFLALLRDEYNGSDELRDLNSLIDLISKDEYERIKNRVILDDKSRLITKKILDYEVFAGSGTRFFYINPDILERIFHSTSKQKGKLILSREDYEIFDVITPKRSIGDVVLPQSTKDTISALLKQINPKVMGLLKTWGIKDKKTLDARIIFYGKSGTGKTITALAIAKELKREVLSLDCSKVLSMYVGESEKNVRKIFDLYKEISARFKNPPVLLLDEADQFLSLRVGSGGSADKMHNQMQNIFLEQIEKFDGILIATTNLVQSIDFAFSRRFNHKIEFKLPSAPYRYELWRQYLPKNATYINTTPEKIAEVLSEYELSGGQIALITKNVAYKIACQSEPEFRLEDFKRGVLSELNSSFGEDKNMGFKL